MYPFAHFETTSSLEMQLLSVVTFLTFALKDLRVLQETAYPKS